MIDNVIIAQFMQLQTANSTFNVTVYLHKTVWYEKEELSYEVSWDWLMPVVKYCYQSTTAIVVGDITHGLLDCDIKSTHKAVVEFIKEYKL